MKFISAAAPPPSPPHPAVSPRMTLCRNPVGVRRRWKLKVAPVAAGAKVSSPSPLRGRSQRMVVASSGAQIPPSPRQAPAKRPPSRRPRCRIQSRGSSNRKHYSSAAHHKKYNAPYYWGARRARSALVVVVGGGGCDPAISPVIDSRVEKRKYFCAFCYYSPAWGAKRARFPIRGGGDFKQVVDPVPPHVDWANLGDGPAGLIAEFALANDVADYVRFRAVCRPWRRCSPDPRTGGLDGRFLPRQWIMLDKAITASPRCHRFLNISTGECIRMGLPELDEHIFIMLTPEGLLMLLHEPTLVVRLLNPITRQLIDLPPVTTLLTEDKLANINLGLRDVDVSGVGLAGASTVVVSFCSPMVLASANPGDDCWTVVYSGHLDSAWSFAGRFYCCIGTRIMVLDGITGSDQQPPQLRLAVERTSLFRFSRMEHSLHLVDNAGELMLVHRSLQGDPEYICKRKYDVYKVDLDVGALVPIKSFNGRAVFMGWYRTVSVAAETLPSITADTLYLGSDIDERGRIKRCNLADGSTCSYSSIEMHPYNLVDCLSHCIQGTGKELVYPQMDF